ncbi:MAG: PIG-L family deacetylase [Verrucomicrobia bacterium]|nr:PIG-L family deacetylase [Verrucomicrobiota bacterium]
MKAPQRRPSRPRALAIAAHPDDIEFSMAGTLLLLAQAGWELHYLNLASGNCGSLVTGPAQTRAIRRRESQAAARLLGAQYHRSFTDDLEIYYEDGLIRRVAAVVREVQPTVLLTHSPEDYMEDHMNTSRIAVSAAFVRGMPNCRTVPARAPTGQDVTVYHALPHGLRDGLRRRVIPGAFVDTSTVQAAKRAALAAHASQKAWLDQTQGMDSYLDAMDQMGRAVGRMSRRFKFAEGWRRHDHLGFCAPEADPLAETLGPRYFVNRAYERKLGQPAFSR